MNSSNKLEALSNLAMTTVAVLLSVVLVKELLLPQPKPTAAPARQGVSKGASLKASLRDVDWARNGRTVVLAISTQCHYCTDSAPFFQKLWKEKPPNTKVLAVLPQPVSDGREYLNKEGVHVDGVKQVSLNTIGVIGTPTLLLVDKTGTVAEVWRGKLPADQEEAVLRALRAAP